ncbi:DUF502 domain-containing protein [Calderihabitans maritimus]|uniref:Uncharacterized conserved protein n=1 Tax=Calderihabitans maritimus TaxID=1246530 RepID=A0A1Z5HVS3_9FIRM|nr:DUF502 domain-containing protein [Calderihabitans maritimus]GAW93437.1 uncharacterized conserved protein [Calderihabitans maritimus]
MTGIVVLLPGATTIYVLWRLFLFLDRLAGDLVYPFTGIIPGLGLLLTLLFVVLAGLLTTNIVGRKLIAMGEYILLKVPFASTVYRTAKQIVEAFIRQDRRMFREVVLVEYPRPGVYALAFVTGETKGEVRDKVGHDMLNIFLPTTPNPTSGFLLMVPKADVIPLEMSVEEAIKMIISGGLVTPPYRSR